LYSFASFFFFFFFITPQRIVKIHQLLLNNKRDQEVVDGFIKRLYFEEGAWTHREHELSLGGQERVGHR